MTTHTAPLTLFDTHAHLDMDSFRDEVDQVVLRAREVGVTMIAVIGSGGGPGCQRSAVELAEGHDGLVATAGVHPHDAATYTEADEELLRELAREGRIVALGETGLDYYYDNSPRDVQRRVLERHVILSEETGLPLVVHVRDAFDDAVALLEPLASAPGRAVIHCFSGGPDEAARYLEMGFYISFSGIVTFPKATDVQAAAVMVPDDRILAETDSPYLAPVPRRGRRNEPANVAHTVRYLASLRGVSPEAMAATTYANGLAFYGLD